MVELEGFTLYLKRFLSFIDVCGGSALVAVAQM